MHKARDRDSEGRPGRNCFYHYAILSLMKPFQKEWINVILGGVVFILPLLGFPRGFNSAIYMLSGLAIAVIALRSLRLIYRADRQKEHEGPPKV